MIDNNNELWEVIKDFPMYEVSSLGRVKSHYSGRILKPFPVWNDYLKVILCKDGKVYTKSVHRLVGQAFIPNPDNLPCIDHINGVKTDNRLCNLRWCSYKENSNYDNHKPYSEEQKARLRDCYYRNRESRIEQVKQYQQDNKEQISEQIKQYYQQHKEEKLEKMKQYYQTHKEQISEQKKQYYQQNKSRKA